MFVQHLCDTHLPFVRARIAASVPEAVGPWILTVIHHAHWGVDLFFVLSGFSLAQPLLARLRRALPEDSEPLAFAAWGRSFVARRAARLYPAYLVALALVVLVVPALREKPSFAASLGVHLVMLQGYVMPGGLAIIGAAWSLTTEVSFYAAWPLLAPRVLSRPPADKVYTSGQDVYATPPPVYTSGQEVYASPGSACTPEGPVCATPDPVYTSGREAYTRRQHRGTSPWAVGAAIVLSVWILRAILHEQALAPGAPPWLLDASQRRWATSRLDQFVLGALAASLHARVRGSPVAPRVERLAPWFLIAATLLLPPVFYLEGSFFGRPFGAFPYALVSLVTAAIVLSAACVPARVEPWLFPAPLRAVGVISYGVFLHHQLAIGVTSRWAGAPGSWLVLGRHAAGALGLSLVMGALSWWLIERPVIERVARLTGGGGASKRPPRRGRARRGTSRPGCSCRGARRRRCPCPSRSPGCLGPGR